MIKLALIGSIVISSACYTGCGFLFFLPATSSPINAKWESGQPLCNYDYEKSDEVVVLVSASGGGKRAAAFAFGVLQGLSKIKIPQKFSTLLKEVDFFSGVSGGSVPIAYYALHQNSVQEFYQFTNFLKEDTRWELVKRFARPSNWFKSNTLILADHFGDTLFENHTFNDLFFFHRPVVIITAADLSRGQRFNFNSDQFYFIKSDFCNFPIKYAVAASAAYPIFFHNLSLKNFDPFPCEGDQPIPPNKKCGYIPLTDGGILDNYGTRGYLDLLERGRLIGHDPKLNNSNRRSLARGVIFIRINAGRPLEPHFHEKAESPGFLARLSRSYEVTYERQIRDSHDIFLDYLLKRTEEWNVGYCHLDIDLQDANFNYTELKELRTDWTLKEDQIIKLISEGEAMLTRDGNPGKIQKAVAWLQGEPIGISCE